MLPVPRHQRMCTPVSYLYILYAWRCLSQLLTCLVEVETRCGFDVTEVGISCKFAVACGGRGLRYSLAVMRAAERLLVVK